MIRKLISLSLDHSFKKSSLFEEERSRFTSEKKHFCYFIREKHCLHTLSKSLILGIR